MRAPHPYFIARTHTAVCVCVNEAARADLFTIHPLFVEKVWPEGAEDGRTYRYLKLTLVDTARPQMQTNHLQSP